MLTLTQKTLLTALQERRYRTWHLRDIGLWQGGYSVESAYMRAIAQSIPSISSLRESGDEGYLLPIALRTTPFP
jgi:hypothetical protein